jgi:hypothetical protein
MESEGGVQLGGNSGGLPQNKGKHSRVRRVAGGTCPDSPVATYHPDHASRPADSKAMEVGPRLSFTPMCEGEISSGK